MYTLLMQLTLAAHMYLTTCINFSLGTAGRLKKTKNKMLLVLTCGDSASSILYHSFLTKFSLSKLIELAAPL